MIDDLGLSDDDEPGTDLTPVGPSPDEWAANRMAKWQSEAQLAKNRLRSFTENLPTSREFKNAGAMIVLDVINKIASGEMEFRNADEATKSAERIVAMLREMDLSELGQELEDVPPEDRKALLKEFKDRAKELKS